MRAAVLAVALVLCGVADCARFARPASGRPGAHTCQELYFEQPQDHFGAHTGTYKQRYLLNDTWWRPGGPILFYAGNEGAVEVYADWMGLMWEQAPTLGAALVFAEHRYWGKSQPFGTHSVSIDPTALSVEQALADYASLADHLRCARPSPVIAVGGSYGGMLAAWLRKRYRHIFVGALAASAPVGAFVDPSRRGGFDPSAYWAVVSRAAGPASGAAVGSVDNTARLFRLLFELGRGQEGRDALAAAFRSCSPLQDEATVQTLAYWVQGAFDAFAMGNYHFPSWYIAGSPRAPLPAWPLRAACVLLGGSPAGPAALLEGMKAAVDVLYNATRSRPCHKIELTGPAGGPGLQTYLYLWCTEAMPQELPFFPARGPPHDMFWNQESFNASRWEAECKAQWGVRPRWRHLLRKFGGAAPAAWRDVTNIVWTNGELDPWHVGGVLHSISGSSVALQVGRGAHHVDLMWSRMDDPRQLQAVRQEQVAHMRRWV